MNPKKTQKAILIFQVKKKTHKHAQKKIYQNKADQWGWSSWIKAQGAENFNKAKKKRIENNRSAEEEEEDIKWKLHLWVNKWEVFIVGRRVLPWEFGAPESFTENPTF